MNDRQGAPAGDRSREPVEPVEPVEPAPYAWLDDDNRMAGTISPGATTFIGGFFVVAALAVAVSALTTHHLGGLWITLGFALVGAQAVRMGVARRAWRGRHPGVDPLSTVPSPTGGSAFGPDTRAASIGRWALLVLCVVLGALFVVAAVQAITSGGSVTAASLGTKVLLVALAAAVLAVGWYDLRRILRLRAERRRSAA